MKQHQRKMIAPVIVSLLTILYHILYFGLLITLLDGVWKYALGVIPLALSIVMIKVCMERIDEIKKGEEDAARKY